MTPTPDALVTDRAKLIEFAETQVTELMKFHLEDMAILREEAKATFTFAATALSASFGYLLAVYEPRTSFQLQRWIWLAPTIALNIHLAWVAAHVLTRAMVAREVRPLGNEPNNLLSDELLESCDIEGIRLAECRNQQDRIEHNRSRNVAVAAAINRARRGILYAPLTFLATWAAAALLLWCLN